MAAMFLVFAPVPVIERVISIADLRDESNYDRICMAEAGARMIGRAAAARGRSRHGQAALPALPPSERAAAARRRICTTPTCSSPPSAGCRRSPPTSDSSAARRSAAWRGFRRERARGAAADLHLGVLAALAGFSIAALFENNWGDTEVQRLVLFLLAVPFAIAPNGEAAAAPAGAGSG